MVAITRASLRSAKAASKRPGASTPAKAAVAMLGAPKYLAKVKTKKVKGVFAAPTHGELGQGLMDTGRDIGNRVKTTKALFQPYKRVRTSAAQVTTKEMMKYLNDWGRFWRGLDKGTDELVSTSSVRQVIRGIVSAFSGAIPDKDKKQIDEILAILSDVRIPTKYSGYATQGEVMQHPTEVSSGVFGNPRQTGSAHSRMDRERRWYVLESGKEYMAANPNASAVDVVGAIARAAIEHTLNYFTAPVSADNVFDYSKLKGAGRQQLGQEAKEQVEMRDLMKAAFKKLGGQLRDAPAGEAIGDASLRRLWDNSRPSNLTNVLMLRRRPSAARLPGIVPP